MIYKGGIIIAGCRQADPGDGAEVGEGEDGEEDEEVSEEGGQYCSF